MAGRMPSKVNENQISDIVFSHTFNNFHNAMREELSITEMNYELVLKKHAEDESGYVDTATKARTKINKDWDRIEEVALLEEGLTDILNLKFSKIYNEYFNEVVELVIKYALIHELVHVKQFKEGRLTREKMEDLKSIPYSERDVEMEANQIANATLSANGDLEYRIIEVLTTNKSIDNDNLQELIALFKE